MNAKYFVPFETTKILKKKGYRKHSDYYWMINPEEPLKIVSSREKDLFESHLLGGIKYMIAPTYHEVLNWLEEKYNIQVIINYDCYVDRWKYVIRCVTYNTYHNTREKALNAAILKALELI